jgi:hypothetical protein
VRFLDHVETSYFTFVRQVPDFAWKAPAPANYVDERVFAKLELLQYLPSDTCPDEEFLRRVFLDVTGSLPKIDETRAFLATAPDRQAG